MSQQTGETILNKTIQDAAYFTAGEDGYYHVQNISPDIRNSFLQHELVALRKSEGEKAARSKLFIQDGIVDSSFFLMCFPIIVQFGDGKCMLCHENPESMQREMDRIEENYGKIRRITILKPLDYAGIEESAKSYKYYTGVDLGVFLRDNEQGNCTGEVVHLIHSFPRSMLRKSAYNSYTVVAGNGLITFWDEASKKCFQILEFDRLLQGEYPTMNLEQMKEYVYQTTYPTDYYQY